MVKEETSEYKNEDAKQELIFTCSNFESNFGVPVQQRIPIVSD